MFTKTKNKLIKILLTIISFAGLSLTLAEIVLNAQGQSICTTSACQLVHTFDAYNLLNWIGLCLFGFLFFTSLLDLINIIFIDFFLRLRVLVVTGAIIVEGYFIGLQTWFLGEYCFYCLTVAGLIFLFAILDYYYQKKNNGFAFIYGGAFAGALAVFLATFLVNVPLRPIPQKGVPLLIFKKDCEHCQNVAKFVKKEKLQVLRYPAKSFIPVMQVLGIRGVPVLIYPGKNGVEIVVGDKPIIEWFKKKLKDPYFLSQQAHFEGGVCDITSGKPCK
jgi:uncharacterized membrane protein